MKLVKNRSALVALAAVVSWAVAGEGLLWGSFVIEANEPPWIAFVALGIAMLLLTFNSDEDSGKPATRRIMEKAEAQPTRTQAYPEPEVHSAE